jgi:hypothetical protein
MRCATFIDEWISASFGCATVVGALEIPFARKRLEATGAAIERVLPQADGFVLLVDSYDPAIRSESLQTPGAVLTVLMDDLGGIVEGYDVVWNPNAYRSDNRYPEFKGRIISERVPIRSGLPAWRGGSSRLGVSIGGGDPAPWLVEGFRHWAKMLPNPPIAPKAKWIPVDWEQASPDDIWRAFADCDVLVTAAGSTIWEAACVGIPVCTIQTMPNQALIAQWLRSNKRQVIQAVSPIDPEAFSLSLTSGVKAASRLPKVKNGAREAADMLYSWAS